MTRTTQQKIPNSPKISLESLLCQLQPEHRNTFRALSNSALKSSIQLYSSEQAEVVFLRLLKKCKIQKERKNWKSNETSYLFFIIDKYCILNKISPKNLQCIDWHNISEYVPGRSANDCKFRYMAMTSNSITNTPWSSQEKQLLLRIIQNQKSNTLNWRKISQQLYDLNSTIQFRTGKQCREQYTCFLNPNLKKGAWTVRQDYRLICLFQKYGRKWSLIAKEMQGRNENAIKNRFYLLFQQKRMLNLSSSDLNKRIKRKKQRIEKECFLKLEDCGFLQENLANLQGQNSSKRIQETQRSNFEESQAELNSQSSLHGNIFAEQATPFSFPSELKIIVEDQSECILRYINF